MTSQITSVAAPRRVSGLAVAGFILSTSFLFSGLGIIFSAISLEQFRGYRGREVVGKKLAFAGLIIGIAFSFFGFIIYLLLMLNAPALNNLRYLLYYL